jgi:DNA-binding CsgD family transcriptional regulator
LATRPEPILWDRRAERERLDAFIAAARGGTSGTLVMRGEAGVGKSALLDYLLSNAAACRLLRAAGVESEMELAFATLHQLCAPFLDRLDRLRVPQRDALAIAFGLQSGPPPERFFVGLAVLSLLAEVADSQPLICLIDDVQWLDHASAQVLGFVARRLAQEAVVMIFAVREPWEATELAGLTQLTVGPLPDADARELLAATLPGRLDEPVRERIVAESHGNPLALLELPRAWTAPALAGGFGLPDGASVSAKIEESFRRRMTPLPDDSRRLLLVAAADPVGDPALIRAAADRLGIPADAADPATTAGLLDGRADLRFRHPMVRSVVYQDAAFADRRLVHRALAEVTDPGLDPDRRAWHLAAATSGPDEAVALELERSADRAQARGGVAAAAAFLERAVALTKDPGRKAERALVAAQAKLQAGAFDAVTRLLAEAETGPLSGFQRARIDLVRGHVALAAGAGSDSHELLFKAARALEPFDVELARETYLSAWGASGLTGHPDEARARQEISRAALALRVPNAEARPLDLLLEGLALLTTDGYAAANPTLQLATKALVDMPLADVLRVGWMATSPGALIWDFEGMLAISARQVRLVREAGALAQLPLNLAGLGLASTWLGDLQQAASAAAESESVSTATGSHIAPFMKLRLLAVLGREAEASEAVARAIEEAAARAQRLPTWAHGAAAVLYNGLARYDLALAAAMEATAHPFANWVRLWALPELVEAAARMGEIELAGDALAQLAATTRPAGNDAALGLEARCRALLSIDGAPEAHYREAIARLGRTRLRPELARAHLLYGEWLRRVGMRVQASEQLHTAHDLFVAIGMEAFAERTRRELLATGEHVRKRTVETRDDLTPQERQIAYLASEGLTNPEIGAQLFLSRRTVEWHLRKVFGKLEIASRRELAAALRRATRT